MGCGCSKNPKAPKKIEEDEDNKPIEKEEENPVEETSEDEYDSDFEEEMNMKYERHERPTLEKDVTEEAELFDMETENTEDHIKMSQCIKPWEGAIAAPTDWDDTKEDELGDAEPEKQLQIEFVHGYKCFDSRSNIFFSSAGTLIYPTAACGVVFDSETRSQKVYSEHDDDIISLAVHPEGVIVATGQVGKHPVIRIWDSETMATVKVCKPFHKRGVAALAWSSDGKYLVSAGLENHHSVAIWSASNGSLVCSAEGGVDKIVDIAFNSGSNNEFMTVGVKHVRFWTFDEVTKALNYKKGLFGTVGKTTNMTQAAYTKNKKKGLCGSTGGGIYIWEGRNLESVVKKAHKGACLCLTVAKDGTIFSGGKDGRVVAYNEEDGKPMGREWSHPNGAKINCIAVKDNGDIAVGSRKADIWMLKGGIDGEAQCVIDGHSSGELWGLAVHPSKNTFVTAGDDCKVAVWDMETRLGVNSTTLKCKGRKRDRGIRCVAISSDGNHVAAGLRDGNVTILDFEELKEIDSFKVKDEPTDMKYSPTGDLLAVGTRDHIIQIYDGKDGYKNVGTCKGHSSTITHLDWSDDGEHLQSTCQAYELLFWNKDGTQETSASELKDITWSTWTCVLGWPVQGIYPPESDGTDINAVDRNHSKSLLASADDFGKLNTHNYPSIKKTSKRRDYNGHCSHVTNVRWAQDDERLITTGGMDNTVIQWKVVDV